MTYSKTTHRLIICDVTAGMVTEDRMREFLTTKLKLSGLNIFYERHRHLSLFVDYCAETKHLEIVGTMQTFAPVVDTIVSFKHQIAPSYLSSCEYIEQWVCKMDKEYLPPKPESYDVF